MAAESAADMDLLARRALDIERIEFEKARATNPAYRARIRSLCHNLRDKKNPELRQNVVEGTISAQRFCSMTSEEMASKELRDTIEKMKEENLFKAKGADRAEAATDQFKCGRCKQRKCTFYQLQTRSADEPMTTFVTCTQNSSSGAKRCSEAKCSRTAASLPKHRAHTLHFQTVEKHAVNTLPICAPMSGNSAMGPVPDESVRRMLRL
ncbi:transcription elongation factor TFIIS [Coemansia spiralis]|nr:transcription elongation factor TFIIS [Coemansia spiralis]